MLNKAGLAALTLIEEVSDLSPATSTSGPRASAGMARSSQSQTCYRRLNKAAGKLVSSLRGELSDRRCDRDFVNRVSTSTEKVLEYERSMIKQALAQANGRVTHAASLLRLSYQGLAYIIESRHPDLLKERTPVRRRQRKKQ